MIHAMMSEAGSGGRERSHVVSTFGALAADQRRAESEARRVLAETEPVPGRIGRWPLAWHDSLRLRVGDATERIVLRKALAEALSAFLAAPDPAEYLAAVSR